MSIVTTIILLMLLLTLAVMAGRVIGRQQNLISAMAVGGALVVALTTFVTVSLHYLEIPITTGRLLLIYIAINVLLTAMHTVTCRQMPWVITPDITRLLLPGLALFAVIILPYTHFTGIDTYKWQDLATAVNVEQNIPWLVHPLSLLGFTPRSYPSAQPILLATIQIIGNLGIDAGFAVLSLFIAVLGCAAAYFFGLRAFRKPQTAAIYALLYIYTPVFTRYTHWATGRGLFLALFPLLLATMIPPNSRIDDQPDKLITSRDPFSVFQYFRFSVFQIFPLLLLLSLSHKVGFIIALSFIPIYLSGFLVPKQSRRMLVIISILPSAVLALFVVSRTMLPFPAGNAIGIVRYSLTRFGILMPLAILGLIAPVNLFANIKWRRLYPLMLIAIPLAFERHMYGALIAAPLITLAATEGVVWLWGKSSVASNQHPADQQAKNLLALSSKLFFAITIAFAIATVVHRSRIATSRPVYHAAQFLEQHDPLGPYIINAPGRVRTQVQAYVSGCPRFNLTTGTNSVIKISAPPNIKGNPRKVLQNWTTYMRGFMTVPEIATDWYGKNPRRYYITINDQGTHPPEAKQIYNKNGVKIYTP